MKTYVKTTGVVFALIVVAHVARLVEEGLRPATDPLFVLATLLSAGLAVWAWWEVRR